MKRVIAVILTVAMLFVMMTSAFAASVSQEVSATTVSAGQDVTVTLKLDETLEQIGSFEYYIYFNSDLFALASSTKGDANAKMTIGELASDANGSYYTVNAVHDFSNDVGLTISAGTVYTLVFRAKEDLTAQQAGDFKLVNMGVWDVNFTEKPVTVKNATLSVSVSPKEDPQYTVTMPADKNVTVGETVEIPVTVGYTTADQTTYNAIDLQFGYNGDVLQLISTEIEGLTITTGNGTVRVQGYGADKTFAQKAVTLQFRAIAAGEANVTLSSAKVDAAAHAISQDAPEAKKLDDATKVTVTGYTVTLPEDFTGASVVRPNADYTFTAKDKNYDYTFVNTTMGGSAAAVQDNGDGTFTIKNVTGNLVITTQKSGKKFDVTLGTDMTADKSGTDAAQYMTDYTATLNRDTKYNYEVSVTIGGKAYAGYTVSEGGYTIPGADITGDIVFDVVKTLIPPAEHSVTFAGNGAGDIAEGTAATVTDGADYTFLIDKAPGYAYTVTATMGGKEAAVTEETDGYKIAAVTGDLVITIAKESDLAVQVNSYVELDGKTVFLVTATSTLPEGKILSYNGTAMFWSEAYEAYAFLTIEESSFTVEAAKAKIAITDAQTQTLAKDNLDVNESEVVDVNDAQLIYDIYNAKYADFTTVTMAKFLRADVNGSKNVNVEDASMVIAGIQ